jgi:NAD(P)-dependent dehydrogenase (short-subunit alcohol dehydrogenase family)
MKDKKVLVTGANKGIGLETAAQLASLGATVFLGSRDIQKGEAQAANFKKQDLEVYAVSLDVTSQQSIQDAVKTIQAKGNGVLDVLVNNAGVMLRGKDSAPGSLADDVLRTTFETNLFGLVNVTRHCLPLLKRSKEGRIVNVTSILGSLSELSDPNSSVYACMYTAYNMSKAAVNMYTVLLAEELKDTKIKVNAAHPGWVKTDMGGDGAMLEVTEGAKTSVMLATLPDEGPTGGYYHMGVHMRW